jgi:hypothetical protein
MAGHRRPREGNSAEHEYAPSSLVQLKLATERRSSSRISPRAGAPAGLLTGEFTFYNQPVLRPCPFIVPAQPALRVHPPKADAWLHEVKFDGYRCQPHKTGDETIIFSKNGRDFTNRFPGIRDALLTLPSKSAIMDGEVVATTLKTSFACGVSTSWSSTLRTLGPCRLLRGNRKSSRFCEGTIICTCASRRPSGMASNCSPSAAREALKESFPSENRRLTNQANATGSKSNTPEKRRQQGSRRLLYAAVAAPVDWTAYGRTDIQDC